MEFRPCIDIHNGKVKQIVGKSLRDEGDFATENFVSERSAADFARLYKKHGLRGGHVILLNARDSDYYEATKAQAFSALEAYPGGLQIGGGITADNAEELKNYIDTKLRLGEPLSAVRNSWDDFCATLQKVILTNDEISDIMREQVEGRENKNG